MHFHPNQNDRAATNGNNMRQQRPAQGSMLNKWTSQNNQQSANNVGAPPFYPESFDERQNFDGVPPPNQFSQSPFPNVNAFQYPGQQMPNFPDASRQPGVAANKPPPNIAQIWSNGSPNGQSASSSSTTAVAPLPPRGNYAPMNFQQQQPSHYPQYGNQLTFIQPSQYYLPYHDQVAVFQNNTSMRCMTYAPPMRHPVSQQTQPQVNGVGRAQMPPMGFPPGTIPPPNIMSVNGGGGGRPYGGPPTMMPPNNAPSGHLMNIGNLPAGGCAPPVHMNYRPPAYNQQPHQMRHPGGLQPDVVAPQPQHFIPPMDAAQPTSTSNSNSDCNPSLYWKEPEDPMKKRQQETGTLHWGDPQQWNGRSIRMWKEHGEESENQVPQYATAAANERPIGTAAAVIGQPNGDRPSGWDEPEPRHNSVQPQQPQQQVQQQPSLMASNFVGADGGGSLSKAPGQNGRPWSDDLSGRLPANAVVGGHQSGYSQAAIVFRSGYVTQPTAGQSGQVAPSAAVTNVDPFLFEDEFAARLNFDSTNPLDPGDLFR